MVVDNIYNDKFDRHKIKLGELVVITTVRNWKTYNYDCESQYTWSYFDGRELFRIGRL